MNEVNKRRCEAEATSGEGSRVKAAHERRTRAEAMAGRGVGVKPLISKGGQKGKGQCRIGRIESRISPGGVKPQKEQGKGRTQGEGKVDTRELWEAPEKP